jgi:predicted nuclease with RNAse H fold
MVEMDNKFNMVVNELSELKNVLFDLQRFTMNVNEKLFNKVTETSPQDILENIIQEKNEVENNEVENNEVENSENNEVENSDN